MQPATPALNPGERFAGIVLNSAGQYLHHLILLSARPAKGAPWQAQMDWAASVGGDLPSPQEQSILFANCRDTLPEDWCWSNKTHEEDASYAWHCSFDFGLQDDLHKSYEGSAVAVRRLVLESFNPFETTVCSQAQEGTFTHTYRPANVSEGKYSYQRRYGVWQGKHLPDPVVAKTDPQKGRFALYRDGRYDLAEVQMEIGLHSRACIELRMTPQELRESAALLLDAAHDIEAFPSAVFQKGGAA